MKTVLRIKQTTIRITTVVAVALLIMMAALVTWEVILRWGFGKSTMVSTDFAAYAMGILFYWGASKALEDGVFVRMDVLYDLYKGKLKKIMDLIFDFVVLFFNCNIMYHFYSMLVNTFARDLRATNIYETPLWIPRLFLFVGIVVFNIYLICRIIVDFHAEEQQYSNKEMRKLEGKQSGEEAES